MNCHAVLNIRSPHSVYAAWGGNVEGKLSLGKKTRRPKAYSTVSELLNSDALGGRFRLLVTAADLQVADSPRSYFFSWTAESGCLLNRLLHAPDHVRDLVAYQALLLFGVQGKS